MQKPREVFDRDSEWAALGAFVEQRGPALGVLYGRRRQGKSFLLRRLVARTGGLYHQAIEEEPTRCLERFADALGGERGLAPGQLRLRDWREAFDEALRAPRRGSQPRIVVIDELPYLTRGAPELFSALQAAFDAARHDARAPRSRVIVCGSALSIMHELLAGARPLRGRASLELVLRPFDFRESRAFWRIGNIETALWLHAVLGGTPGYRDLVARPPRSVRSFPAWLGRSLLDPAHALFREAEYLLAEEPRLSDKALYHSVLDAVSRGECTPSRIAARLGRSEAAVQHPLRLLEEAGFVIRRADCLRQRRPVYHVADPVIRFHHVVIRPQIAMLEERRVADVWRNVESSFTSQILGPHFEELARVWTGRYASPATLGGNAGAVGQTVVNDPKGRAQIEIDVLALAQPSARDASSRALVVGEAKASERPRTIADLSRLERARSLLQASGRLQASDARLALFARRGFSSELRTVAANRRDVILVDLERLYEGR